MKQKIILDTDIGDDIDDAYALAFILGSSELELIGITTVFQNAAARARQAKTILNLAGREDIPVSAGCGAVMSPRVTSCQSDLAHGQVSLRTAARELLEDVKPCQDAVSLPSEQLTPLHKLHGVDFLIETIMSGPGDIIPVTIGPMTNLAMALIKEPMLVKKIPRIVAMAGCFDKHYSEWNVKCDPVAAAIVFNSQIPMTVVGLDVTLQCRLNQSQMDKLASSDRPVARNLTAATKVWNKGLPVLHDPLAIETIVDPHIVETQNGTITVESNGIETFGYTVFREAKQSKTEFHDVCVSVKQEIAAEFWLKRVLSV